MLLEEYRDLTTMNADGSLSETPVGGVSDLNGEKTVDTEAAAPLELEREFLLVGGELTEVLTQRRALQAKIDAIGEEIWAMMDEGRETETISLRVAEAQLFAEREVLDTKIGQVRKAVDRLLALFYGDNRN